VRGERVIDISFGPGFLCRSIAAAVGPEGQVLTMEFDEESRALLRQIRAVHVRNIERCDALIETKR
jgi:tRNA A58 N-methylase Trm61